MLWEQEGRIVRYDSLIAKEWYSVFIDNYESSAAQHTHNWLAVRIKLESVLCLRPN